MKSIRRRHSFEIRAITSIVVFLVTNYLVNSIQLLVSSGVLFGNFTFGLTEQIVFPEINLDNVSKLNGYNITFVTSSETDKECFALLKEFGFPFKNQK